MVNVSTDALPKAVKRRMSEWKDTYHLQFAPNGDSTWFDVDEDDFDEVLCEEARKTFMNRRKNDSAGSKLQKLSEDEIEERIKILSEVVKYLNKSVIRHKSAKEWTNLFQSHTTYKTIAEDLTTTVMRALATPVPPNR